MEVLKKQDVKLVFGDSLVYEIKTDDVYEDFRKDKHLLDLSNHLKDSKIFDSVNEKAIGKMKDKSKGKTHAEFVGLKSKMQPIKYVDDKENKTGTEVNKNVVKNRKHDEYVDVLLNKKVVRHNMKRIQSKLDIMKLTMFLRFHCLVLMIKGIYQMMTLTLWIIFIKIQEVNKIELS